MAMNGMGFGREIPAQQDFPPAKSELGFLDPVGERNQGIAGAFPMIFAFQRAQPIQFSCTQKADTTTQIRPDSQAMGPRLQDNFL